MLYAGIIGFPVFIGPVDDVLTDLQKVPLLIPSLKHLFVNSNNIVKRNKAVCYFDCTNYFFECEQEDDVYIDPVTGEVLRGLRKYGPSKEYRPNPIVQMGLFMDGNGMPISMCINPGSQNEQLCAIPLEKKIVDMFGTDKLIYCADAGLGSYPIRKYNSMGERAYIVTQSIKKLSGVMKEAVFSDCDYFRKSDNTPGSVRTMKELDRFDPDNRDLYNDTIYKVIIANKTVDTGLTEIVELKNGKKREQKVHGELKQYIIVSFSRKMMEYQRHIRNGQIGRAKELLKSRDPEMIKKGPNDVTRFINGNPPAKAVKSQQITTLLTSRLLRMKSNTTVTMLLLRIWIAENMRMFQKSLISVQAETRLRIASVS